MKQEALCDTDWQKYKLMKKTRGRKEGLRRCVRAEDINYNYTLPGPRSEEPDILVKGFIKRISSSSFF